MGHSIGFRQHGFRWVCCAKVFNFCLKKLLLIRINQQPMKHILFLTLLLACSPTFQAQKYRFLVGTYTNTGKSQGIYCYEMNSKTGVVTQKSVTAGVSNPSFLCVTPDKKFVYSVNESAEGSAANAFAFDANAGKLTFLNRSMTEGKGPCSIAATSTHVFTANYGGGSLSVFGRNSDGTLSDLKQKIQHIGSSMNLDRQSEPHVHQVLISNDKRFILANDLGTDKVTVYQYNPNVATEILTPSDTLNVKSGSGPRHSVFSRNGKIAYLVQELDGTVSVMEFKKGKLRLLQETTLLKEPDQKGWAADIHLSPDGKFLYATNRGPANNITCFWVLKDGRLEFLSQCTTRGDGPRNFAISPDGKFLLVAHQFSNEIVIFQRDKKTGALTDTGERIDVGAPVCLVFY
jgi:6-phosphogluconolactonase